MNNYYVYQLIDPRSNLPFYIGEGKGKRAWSHLTFNSGCNNPHKDRVIQKIYDAGLEVVVEIVQEGLTKIESRNLEGQLIEKIGIDKLTNICLNANPPILPGNKNGFYGKTHTEESKKKIGRANKGKNTKTEAGSKAISDALKDRWKDPTQRENQTNALKSRKGEKRSEEAIESYKKSAKLRDSKLTSEQRSARSAAGAATKKIKYAGFKRQSFIDENGRKRFRYVPKAD